MQGKENPPLRRSQPGQLRAGHGACPSPGPALRAVITCLPGRGMRAACGRVSSSATASTCAGRSSRGSPCSAQADLGHLLLGPACGPPGLPEPPQGRVKGGLVSWCCSLGGAGYRPGPHGGGAAGGAAGEVGQRPGRSAATPSTGQALLGRPAPRRGDAGRGGGSALPLGQEAGAPGAGAGVPEARGGCSQRLALSPGPS